MSLNHFGMRQPRACDGAEKVCVKTLNSKLKKLEKFETILRCLVMNVLQTRRMQIRRKRFLHWGWAIGVLVPLAVMGAGLPAIKLTSAFPNLHFNRPLWMEEIPDDSHRLVVVEQDGKMLIFSRDSGVKEAKTFLDISSRKPHVENEEGLLAFAFHPQYRTNGLLYIDYVQQSPKRTLLSEFRVSKTDSNMADLASERVLMQVSQPYWNHKGGTMLFGSDGLLYVSLGDGGSGGDPHNVGQSLHHLLGKILRIDVNSRTGLLGYGIPKDNPFVGRDKAGNPKSDPFDTMPSGHRPEIWAYGLRNVWRMSFDRETGELWAGEVGQDKWEEVDIITRGGNYGWNVLESLHDFKKGRLQGGAAIDPIIEYPHNARLASECKFPEHTPGLSITGGYVYRGKKYPPLQGVYLYSDFVLGTVWGLKYENGKVVTHGVLLKENAVRQISSFAEDRAGELYAISFDGSIYAISAE
jgi:quinoprotein glucose dehydrogenase